MSKGTVPVRGKGQRERERSGRHGAIGVGLVDRVEAVAAGSGVSCASNDRVSSAQNMAVVEAQIETVRTRQGDGVARARVWHGLVGCNKPIEPALFAVRDVLREIGCTQTAIVRVSALLDVRKASGKRHCRR